MTMKGSITATVHTYASSDARFRPPTLVDSLAPRATRHQQSPKKASASASAAPTSSRVTAATPRHPHSLQRASHVTGSSSTDADAWSLYDICWAQCAGYPYWPGVIVELRPQLRLACVAFYDGKGDVAEAQWFPTNETDMKKYGPNRK